LSKHSLAKLDSFFHLPCRQVLAMPGWLKVKFQTVANPCYRGGVQLHMEAVDDFLNQGTSPQASILDGPHLDIIPDFFVDLWGPSPFERLWNRSICSPKSERANDAISSAAYFLDNFCECAVAEIDYLLLD
jgi:hypothetical protein